MVPWWDQTNTSIEPISQLNHRPAEKHWADWTVCQLLEIHATFQPNIKRLLHLVFGLQAKPKCLLHPLLYLFRLLHNLPVRLGSQRVLDEILGRGMLDPEIEKVDWKFVCVLRIGVWCRAFHIEELGVHMPTLYVFHVSFTRSGSTLWTQLGWIVHMSCVCTVCSPFRSNSCEQSNPTVFTRCCRTL